MKTIRIATRGSLLAVRQSQLVADAIRARHPGLAVELVPLVTRGDRRRGPLAPVGGKGLFTRELEEALRAGRVHVAVHSAKDLPAAMDPDFAIVAVPPREDARDAIVSRYGGLDELPRGATVGTGSLRRRAQLLAVRDDLNVAAVRGNIETRVKKALAPSAELDAVVLAMAGLKRSGLAEQHGGLVHPLEAADFIPAAGQGTLAVQVLASETALAELVAPLDDTPAHQALLAERGVLRELGADCRSCVAVHVAPRERGWHGWAMVARPDGSDMVRLSAEAPSAATVADGLLTSLRQRGADDVLRGR